MPRTCDRMILCAAIASVAGMLLAASPELSGAKRDQVNVKDRITEAAALHMQTQLFDALSNSDGATLEKLMAEDVVFVHLNGRTQTRTELLAQAAGNKRPGKVTFNPIGTDVHVYDGLVVLSGTVDVTETGTGADGAPESHRMHVRLSDVWTSGPEGWRVVLLQGTNEPGPKEK